MPSCKSTGPQDADNEFPRELTQFIPHSANPVFGAGPAEAWDKMIRERGYILYEDSMFKMWYTGYKSDEEADTKFLGYATSADGINWQRHPNNPVFTEKWTEDMFVFRYNNLYYMYAEGRNDVAHYMTSHDGISWEEQGDLVTVMNRY
jgi:hypothetical protein